MWFSDERDLGIKHRDFFDQDGALPLQCATLAVAAVSILHSTNTVRLIDVGNRFNMPLMNGRQEYAVGADTVSNSPTKITLKCTTDTSGLCASGRITRSIAKQREHGKKAF